MTKYSLVYFADRDEYNITPFSASRGKFEVIHRDKDMNDEDFKNKAINRFEKFVEEHSYHKIEPVIIKTSIIF